MNSITTNQCQISGTILKLGVGPFPGHDAYYSVQGNIVEMKVSRKYFRGAFTVTAWDLDGSAYVGPPGKDLVIIQNVFDDVYGSMHVDGSLYESRGVSFMPNLFLTAKHSFELRFE
ncbi:uncharacterized protein VTP21DRAFT_7487 [Calcarisporiella thermophila]|uniref:uncharacterized protein n=1 Tax=Calcarisporiella thermophila TaxID=911321 RepID=UPI003742D3F5